MAPAIAGPREDGAVRSRSGSRSPRGARFSGKPRNAPAPHWMAALARRARSAARRQVELGVLERFFDHRNAGGVARLALLDRAADIEALRLLPPLGIHVEILFVLGDQRLAI